MCLNSVQNSSEIEQPEAELSMIQHVVAVQF